MTNITEDAVNITRRVRTLLINQIRNCTIEDARDVQKAFKAYIILDCKLTHETTQRFLDGIEYFGMTGIALAAVMSDYYDSTEVRVSNPLQACTLIIDEFVEGSKTVGDKQYLAGIFDRASEDVKVACHNFLVQYAYYKTKKMAAVSFIMAHLDPIKEL